MKNNKNFIKLNFIISDIFALNISSIVLSQILTKILKNEISRIYLSQC